MLLTATLAVAGVAVAAGPQPGEYITEGGWGRLTVSAPNGEGLPFAIDAVGVNFHLCHVEGTIVGDRAIFPGDGEADCEVAFRPVDGGLDVSAEASTCLRFCGARAAFAGRYRRPAAGCGDDERRAARDAFKRRYDAKRYVEALSILSPLPERCRSTLSFFEDREIRNDIAIAQYRSGDSAGCLRTLEPFVKDAATPDDEVEIEGWIAEREAYQPILDAARFNLRLCRRPAR